MTQSIETLGILEQNLASLVSQKNSFSKQLLEIEQALSELSQSTNAYQIIGTIMIQKESADLTKELEQKKETISIKLESVKKQEEALRKQVLEVQSSLMNKSKGE